MSDFMIMLIAIVVLGTVLIIINQIHHNGWCKGWDDCKKRFNNIDRREKPCELYDETSELFDAYTMKCATHGTSQDRMEETQ